MGRETKILLALLATLAGVFVGVLSMKLLVPRPPAGAGPDVHVDLVAAEPHEIVAPPTLSPPTPEDGMRAHPRSADGGFDAAGADQVAVGAGTAPRRDPFVATASLEQPLPRPDQPAAPPVDGTMIRSAAPTGTAFSPSTLPLTNDPAAIEPPGVPPERTAIAPPPTSPTPPSPTHVAAAGDSWWNLAERAYGDGRLYRALFAWNRVVDPRVSLAPGTRLEIPPRERLEAAWPRLVPPR
jgi:nucleoid-associated protein YgaU